MPKPIDRNNAKELYGDVVKVTDNSVVRMKQMPNGSWRVFVHPLVAWASGVVMPGTTGKPTITKLEALPDALREGVNFMQVP